MVLIGRSTDRDAGRQGAASGDPVRTGPLLFVIMQKGTDIDCVQIESQQIGKVRVKRRESEEMVEHHATSPR